MDNYSWPFIFSLQFIKCVSLVLLILLSPTLQMPELLYITPHHQQWFYQLNGDHMPGSVGTSPTARDKVPTACCLWLI